MKAFYVIFSSNPDIAAFEKKLFLDTAFNNGYTWNGGIKDYSIGKECNNIGVSDKKLSYWSDNKPDSSDFTRLTIKGGLEELRREPEPVYKAGDWVVLDFGYLGGSKYIVKLNMVDEESVYYDVQKGLLIGHEEKKSKRLRLATDDEVKEYLLAEAKKRYPIGTRFKSVIDSNIYDNSSAKLLFRKEIKDIIWVYVDYSAVYRDDTGQWAKIIKDEPMMIGNHKVIKNNDIISVGCLIEPLVVWKDLLNNMELFELKTIQHKDGTIATYEQIKKLTEM